MSRPTKEESIHKVSIHKNGGYMYREGYTEMIYTDIYIENFNKLP